MVVAPSAGGALVFELVELGAEALVDARAYPRLRNCTAVAIELAREPPPPPPPPPPATVGDGEFPVAVVVVVVILLGLAVVGGMYARKQRAWRARRKVRAVGGGGGLASESGRTRRGAGELQDPVRCFAICQLILHALWVRYGPH